MDLEHGRNIPRARSKRTSSTVQEKYLKRSRRMAPTQSKDTSSLIETYLKHCQNLHRARLKYTSSTVETYIEHGQTITPRARSEHTNHNTSIMVETQLQHVESCLMHCRNMPWRRWKNTWSTVELHFEHGQNRPRER